MLASGLPGDESDMALRQAAFGRNEIPPKAPKSFFRLMFDALQDVTLVILIICAVISFALSFYHPSGDTFEAEIKPSRSLERSRSRTPSSRSFRGGQYRMDRRCGHHRRRHRRRSRHGLQRLDQGTAVSRSTIENRARSEVQRHSRECRQTDSDQGDRRR